jgi:dihydroorotate dehydrogenase (fumarate)
MGRKLRTPLVPSASPLSETLDSIERLEDAGASAVVLYSVFQEQIENDMARLYEDFERGSESFAEAVTYFPRLGQMRAENENYLEHIRRAKARLDIPVFASINGFTPGGWTDYARQIQQAGADGVELNAYFLATDPGLAGADLEARYLETAKAVRAAVTIPVSVKLSPFFTSLPHFAASLASAGVDALTLFNRFYQPDIDLEDLTVKPAMTLSTSESLRLPLRWTAILHGRVKVSLGLSSGVHTGMDALKAVSAGADAVFLCSALLKNGIPRLKEIEAEMARWLERKDYESLSQLKGSMSQAKCGCPAAFERALYIEAVARPAGVPAAV